MVSRGMDAWMEAGPQIREEPKWLWTLAWFSIVIDRYWIPGCQSSFTADAISQVKPN